MTVNRTPRGTWQVRWRDPTGRQRSKTFSRKVDAEAFERDTLVDQRRGTWIDPDRSRITLKAWSVEWLAGAHNVRPRTRETYETALAHILPELGAYQLDSLLRRPELIDQYLAAKTGPLAPSTVHRHYRVLRRMLRVAVQRGRIPRSPIDSVAEPRIPHTEMRFLTAEQLETLADVIDLPPEPDPSRTGRRKRQPRTRQPGARYRTLVLVAGWGGPRWGELAGLTVPRVDVAGNRVHIVEQLDLTGRNPSPPKTAAGRRWVSLPASVVAELAAHIDGRDGLVWTAPGGSALAHPNFMRRIWIPAAVRAELGTLDDDHYDGVTPHDLRHTSVALAIAQGAHPKAIQLRMGHATIQITFDRYGHLFPQLETELGAKLDDARSRVLTERRRLRVV